MNGKEFREALPPSVRAHLPAEWQHVKHASRFAFVQFWYDEPTFHFEIWPQHKYGVIEIGLHLEHRDPAHNAALHAFFDRHFVEIRHLLGELWLERWDRGWHKLYKTLPLTPYDEGLVEHVSQEAARQIVVLQPLLVEGLLARVAQSNSA